MVQSTKSYFLCLCTEHAAGVYHRESRKGRYQLTYKEAIAVCKYEGGTLATAEQLEAARQIGLLYFYHIYATHGRHFTQEYRTK